MSRPAWMTDELEEEWVEPEWEEEGDDNSQSGSQRSRRSTGSAGAGRATLDYGSVRVGRSSPTLYDNSSTRDKSIRGLLQGDDGKRKNGLSSQPGTVSGTSKSEVSPIVGTFLVREDVAQEPLKAAAPAALKKSAAKTFFAPLALEKMFEPPSPPAGATQFGSPLESRPQPPSPVSAQPQPSAVSPIHIIASSPSADSRPTVSDSTPSTSPTSFAPSKHHSPGNTTPSPHASPASTHTPSPASTSSSHLSGFSPSPSAGRGPLGTFRLPHHHAPIRPSRLSESHLVKPYASFEAEESFQSSVSVSKDILADLSNIQHEERPFGSDPETSLSGKIPMAVAEDDEECLTNDLDFRDDELIVGDDGDGDDGAGDADGADSILDATSSDLSQQLKQDTRAQAPQQQEWSQSSASTRATPQPDEIIDTDIPGLSLINGRKPVANYRFTFTVPRNDGGNPATQTREEARAKRSEERRREREAERERRRATRALFHPHNALRSITPDLGTDSRSSSRASSHMDEPVLREGYRTPSPGMLANRDPRLKLFQFHYDTFTRDQLSALVDSIAVGSVGSSPSVQQINTMEFRGDDPHALSTPSDAVRYAKKIKLTPPEDFSDWDGERSGDERGEGESGDNGAEERSRSTLGGNNYVDAARNLMRTMRDARSLDGQSAVSTAQQSTEQGEEEMDLDDELHSSSGSAANDYRRRGADLMAQLREELSDDEDGSARDGSTMTRGDGSTNGGSPVIRLDTLQPYQPNQDALSPSELVVNRSPQSSFGRRSQRPGISNQDPVAQLASSMDSVELDGKASSIQSSPRQFSKKRSAEDLPRQAGRDRGPVQPPRITILDASPDPRTRERPTTRGRSSSDLSARIQPPHAPEFIGSRPLAQSYTEAQRPVSPARHDMNRFVSSSSTHTGTNTARSAGSYVKHPGPPIPGVRQIVPSDLPAEALPERVGRMVYDRAAMRWRQEVDENISESEDPFRDFDSFASTVEGRESEEPRPMDAVDELEMEMEHDSGSESNVTLNDPARTSTGQKAVQMPITYDSDVSTELNVVDVSPTASATDIDNDELRLYEPSPKAAPAELDDYDAQESEINGEESTNVEIVPARPVGPLRPALKSAASTPATSAGSSRRSILDSPMPKPQSRRSVSFSDGRMSGKIRGLSIRDIANDTSEITSLTLTPPESEAPESEAAPSSRMQRIGNLLDALEDDSMLANLSIAPGKQPPGESDEDEDTTEQSDMGRGDPDVDPDVSRNPRSFARTYSFGDTDRSGTKGNATFLTECSFGVAHERLVELITDVHPYQPYWEPLSEIDLSKKGIESLARLKEFLPNLDRLNVHGNQLEYLSGIPSCLRDLNVAQNQLTSMTSYGHLANLEVLDISNNQIDSVAQLRCLRHLRELSAVGNTISDLSGIGQTTSLVKLNLKGNCLKSVSLEEYNWPHIDNIDFSNNGMKAIAGLSSMPTLVTLNLDHNALTSLPIEAPLPRLRNLRLSDNNLVELDCSSLVNLRTLYADNNKLGTLRHIEKARRLENISLRNQSGRGLHLSVSHIRDVKRLYLSGNPLDPGFLEVPCYNLVYLELAACRLSTLPPDLCRLVPNLRALNLNYNFLTDARPLSGLMRLRKLTVIGSRLKATKPLLRSLQTMKELEMLDFRMNPFSLGWYLPLIVRDVPGALQPSETNGKSSAPWSDLDVKFRRDLPDELYIGRLAYRGLVMRVCPQVRTVDGIEITQPERAKAQKLLLGIEQSHKASMSPAQTKD